ncbi:hypothetical protein CEP54_002086 [Fusarium duplospermum]|uniref:Uncharacterized protein n=1 Tax=Fusarium duplospermum TaxID=1325734 RepID=A0A428QXJ7_9HYPO|nr:hypothetical protein CEP54_002086 [Fusarium duplospermum]
MDVCITAQEPFSCEPIGSKPFEPVQTSQKAANDASSASAPLLLGAESCPDATAAVKELEFELITYDPSNDSSLTHPWDVAQEPIRLPVNSTKSQLLNLLRTQLPTPTSAKKTGTFRLSRTIRRQKLDAVTLFLTFGGVVVPLGPKEEDWHYRNAITKTDLLERTEGEWYLIKEMIAASSSSLKCYIVIRGETPSNRKSSGWWFSSRS